MQSPRIRQQLKDPAGWPIEMRKDWADDQGRSAAGRARDHQIANFRRVRDALDDFGPDAVMVFSKDAQESLGPIMLPQYWVQAHDYVEIKPFGIIGDPANFFRRDPETVVTLAGHPAIALEVVCGLRDRGFEAPFSIDVSSPRGLAHTFVSTALHLDWDQQAFDLPFIPFPLDPFGRRMRGIDGLEPMSPDKPAPMSMARGFDLGAAIASVLRESRWRVALVAAAGWSHANNTSWERSWIHPDIDADTRLFSAWEQGRFSEFARLDAATLEAHGQWELLMWTVLAGAMNASRTMVAYQDFQPNWLFNSNWVTTIFEPT